MSARSILLVGGILSVCYLAGVPVVDWVLSLFQILYYCVSALLWAFWQLLQPAQDQRHSSLPELHQAVLNVTNDASRVADLLDEFMSQYSSDPQLKSKFLLFMAQQADTKYSVVDNKLNWVLWLYSLIWMPLLVLMCLTRMGRGSNPESEKQRQSMPSGRPVNGLQQQQQQEAGSCMDQGAGFGLQHSGSVSGQFEGYSGFSSGTAPRRSRTATTGSFDLPPRYSVPGSFGRPYADDVDGSLRSAASGRSLRQAISSGSIPQVPPRASSDWLHMSRPSKLHATSSLPQPGMMSAKGAATGGFNRHKTMPMPGREQQGLNARLSAAYSAGSDYAIQGGNSSPRGGDVRTAAAVDQAAAAAVRSSSSSICSAGGGLHWASKAQQQRRMMGGVDDSLSQHEDAAAAADVL